MENRIGERTHPCGAPVYTITSSDNTGYLLREPFNLTRCRRSYRNCLIHRIRSGFISRFNNFLIRTCGCIVLKADEKSINRTRTVVPEVSRWLAIKLNRGNVASSTPLLVLYTNFWGSMWLVTDLISWLHTSLSMHLTMIDVSATGRKSLNYLAPGFFGNGHNSGLFPRARHRMCV